MPASDTTTVPLIELRGIRFAFAGEPELFRNLDLTLRRGECAALLGGNGAGKTTLLRLIMGLVRPQGGAIRLFGDECREEKDFAALRPRLGFVFQDADDQLFCPTVEEDVAFGPLNLGLPHEAVHERVRETLEALGLAGFERRVSYKLSGGEKKLVALASVLAMRPEALLLDEPTAGLSDEATERIAGVLAAAGLPCLIASHDRLFLERLGARPLELRDGRIEKRA